MICSLSTSDIIGIISLVVNSSLAIWIVWTLQNKLTNKRYLKDHLIGEIKELRLEYKKFMSDLHSGNLKPKKIVPWFKLMNIKVQDTMEILSKEYEINKDILKNYQIELRELVTEFEEFNKNYKSNQFIALKSDSQNKLITFQQKNNSKFNELIILINNGS
ncbi:hypothetical protein [Robertkochia solimangrovi]|uniref:hypothetical protein n=1 Tax=Robertkochia solimangrovi TaxID=2213046 RepID=UPI00117D3A7C|nr:hypothetical protein [Robertkochia solimangrovi]TRZ45137.1 hypothetical protein DMZ48_05140 [Robertkochia solimangrovi]